MVLPDLRHAVVGSAVTPARWIRVLGLGLLLVGYLLLALGLTGRIGERPALAPPAGVHAAVVNGRAITLATLERLTKQQRGSREQLLQGLIENELLLQRAEALGLLRTDELIRRRAVQLVLDLASAPALAGEPSEALLRRYHQQHAQRFAEDTRVRAEQVVARRGVEGKQKAWEWWRRLQQGEPWSQLARESENVPLLDYRGYLSLPRLEQHYGHDAALAIAATPLRGFTTPQETPFGWHVFRVTGREGGEVIPFEKTRDQVLAEYRRQAQRDLVARYIDGLRRKANIVILPAARGSSGP